MEIQELKMARSSFEEGEDLYEYYKSFSDYSHKKNFLAYGWKLQCPINANQKEISFEILKVTLLAIKDGDKDFGKMIGVEDVKDTIIDTLHTLKSSSTNSDFILALRETGLTKKHFNLKTATGRNSFNFFKDLCIKSIRENVNGVPFNFVKNNSSTYEPPKDKNLGKKIYPLDYELVGDVCMAYIEHLKDLNEIVNGRALTRLIEFSQNLVENKPTAVKLFKKSQLSKRLPLEVNFDENDKANYADVNFSQFLFCMSIANNEIYSIGKYIPQDLLHEKINFLNKDMLLSDFVLLSLGQVSYLTQESDTREDALNREQNKNGLRKLLFEDFEYTRFNESSMQALLSGVGDASAEHKKGREIDFKYLNSIIDFKEIDVLAKVAMRSKGNVPEIIMEKVIAYTLEHGITEPDAVEKARDEGFKL